MKAFILAAGMGSRMRPLTAYTPKPLLAVAGKPILQHIIDALDGKVDEIIILVGWQGSQIKDKLHSRKTDILFAKQDEPLGTAHAISIAQRFVDGDFICMNGDILLEEKALTSFIEHFSQETSPTVAVANVPDPEGYGLIKMDGESVSEIIEKPERPVSNRVNAGLYGFTYDIFDKIKNTGISSRGEYEITDTLKYLIKERKLDGYILPKNAWIELSRPWDLLRANNHILSSYPTDQLLNGDIEKGVHLEGWISIAEGAVVRRGSYIRGPVFIGKDADIGPNCLIRGCTSIGNRCKVGNAVEVKNSIVMDGSNVPHHNYVGDSVIGQNCNLGSGTKVANLRLDDKNIVVTHRGELIETGIRKLGVIMGDNVKTGINSILNTGTIIGEDTFIGPGAVAEGEIGPRSRIQ